MMAARRAIDARAYGRLLARARPMVITTEAENDRMLAMVEQLMAKGENLTPEEGLLLQLLGRLIADFEEKFYQPRDAAPHEVLQELMTARSMKQSDLWELFGSKGRASEAISGKRSISKAQAKKLAEHFNVPVGLFL